MTLSQSPVSELLEAFRAGDGVDLVRESVRLVMQELIEAEATERIGAGLYERTESRTTERNGHRPRAVSTKGGDIELRIPKLRKGSFFPVILEPRRPLRPSLVRGRDGALRPRRPRPVAWTISSKPWASTPGSASPRSLASAPAWTRPSARSATGTWTMSSSLTSTLDATYLHVRNTTSQVVSMAVVVATGDHSPRRP